MLRTKKRSFTLVEMLLAFSILSVVLLSLYGAFWSGIKIQKRSERAQTFIRHNVWVLDSIAKELEAMVAYDFSGSKISARPFEASVSRLSFFLADEEGLKHVEYYLEREEKIFLHRVEVGQVLEDNVAFTQRQQDPQDRYVLMRREEPFASFLRESSFQGDKEILLKGIPQGGFILSFAFLTKEGKSSEIVWKEEWQEDYIPAGVKLKINFMTSRDEKKPKLIKLIYIPTGFWGEDEV